MARVKVIYDKGGVIHAPTDDDVWGRNTSTQTQKSGVRQTLQPVPREQANLEAEKGEVALTDVTGSGVPQTFDIGGQKHATPQEEMMGVEKGTPLNLPNGSFIYSQRLKLTPEEKQYFGINKKGKVTFADAAKKYDTNKMIAQLENQTADNIDIETAEHAISEYTQKLLELALLQESKKGFDGGLPNGVENVLQQFGISPQELMPEEYAQTQIAPEEMMQPQEEVMAMGGLKRYDYAGPVNPYQPYITNYGLGNAQFVTDLKDATGSQIIDARNWNEADLMSIPRGYKYIAPNGKMYQNVKGQQIQVDYKDYGYDRMPLQYNPSNNNTLFGSEDEDRKFIYRISNLRETFMDENNKQLILDSLKKNVLQSNTTSQFKKQLEDVINDTTGEAYEKFVDDALKFNLLNLIANKNGYADELNKRGTQHRTGIPEEHFKTIAKSLGITKEQYNEIVHENSSATIALQSIVNAAAQLDDSKEAQELKKKLGVASVGTDLEHHKDTLGKRGLNYHGVEFGGSGHTSLVDGKPYDNTTQEMLMGYDPEQEYETEQQELEQVKRPEYESPIKDIKRPPYGWSRGDIRNYTNAVYDYLSEKKHLPWRPALLYEEENPVYVSYEGDVQRANAQAQAMRDNAALFGPQAYTAVSQAMLPEIAKLASQAQETAYKTNQGTYNQWAANRMAQRNQNYANQAQLDKQYYDEMTAAQQNYENAKRALRWNAIAYHNIGDKNAAQTYNDNMSRNDFWIDPYTRIVHYYKNDGNMTPAQQQANADKTFMEWWKTTGKYLPEDIRSNISEAKYYSLAGIQPTGRSTTERQEVQQARTAAEMDKLMAKYLGKLNS